MELGLINIVETVSKKEQRELIEKHKKKCMAENILRKINESLKKINRKVSNSNFHIDDESNLCYDNSGTSIKICNILIVPEKKITIENSDNSCEIKFSFKVIINGKKLSDTISKTAEELCYPNWISKELGFEYKSYQGIKSYIYIKEYLSIIFENVNEKRFYNKIGWTKASDDWIYLHSGGCITKDGVCKNYHSELEGFNLKVYHTSPQKSFIYVYKSLSVAPLQITGPLLMVLSDRQFVSWLDKISVREMEIKKQEPNVLHKLKLGVS